MSTTTPPDQHCFREDNCRDHEDHVGDSCCCCGWLADAHTGCDCDDPCCYGWSTSGQQVHEVDCPIGGVA